MTVSFFVVVYFFKSFKLIISIAAGDFVKFGFPMAGTTTIVAWSIIDYQIGYSSAGVCKIISHS